MPTTRPSGSALHILRTTLLGGILFLLPLVLLVLLLDKAIDLAGKVMGPALQLAGIDQFGSVFGIGGATLIAIVGLVALSFAAGLFTRTRAGRRVATRLEDTIFGNLPQYRMAKSLVGTWSDVPGGSGLTAVLVRADPGWQLGYLVEDIGDDWVAVFVPQAPTPMSGNIVYLPASELRATTMTMMEATEIIRRLGSGSARKLKETDLGPAPAAAGAGRPGGPALRTPPDISAVPRSR